MITRDDIIQAFRDDFDLGEGDLLNQFSDDDREELIMCLCSHSEALERAFLKVLMIYNTSGSEGVNDWLDEQNGEI